MAKSYHLCLRDEADDLINIARVKCFYCKQNVLYENSSWKVKVHSNLPNPLKKKIENTNFYY